MVNMELGFMMLRGSSARLIRRCGPWATPGQGAPARRGGGFPNGEAHLQVDVNLAVLFNDVCHLADADAVLAGHRAAQLDGPVDQCVLELDDLLLLGRDLRLVGHAAVEVAVGDVRADDGLGPEVIESGSPSVTTTLYTRL
jgi:hypothetical protein